MYILQRQLKNMQRQMLMKQFFDTQLPDGILAIVVKKFKLEKLFPL